MIKPTLKLFDRCMQGELIRFTEGGQTHWALVGDRGRGRLMLLVLPLNSPPYCQNILNEILSDADEMDILRPPYEGTPLLSYGKDYSIRVDHAGDCNVGGSGAVMRSPGAYVMTDEDNFICCRDDRVATKTAYFDLKTGAVRGQPGGLRAVFAAWELALTAQPPTTLLRVQASNP
jgi:hypothetical protein